MLYKLIILLPVLLLMILHKINDNDKKIKMIVIITLILLWCYSTFREFFLSTEMIGRDYTSYKLWFSNTSNINSLSNIGFNLLIVLTKLITNNYIVFLGICNVIIILGFYKFSKENSKDYPLSLFVFLTFGIFELTFNGLRQCIACSIWLLGFKYLYNNSSFLKYLLITILASSFHSSAIILVILYPLFQIKIKTSYKVILVLPLFLLLKRPEFIQQILQSYSSIDDIYLLRYSNSTFSTSNYVVFLVSLTIFILCILKFKAFNKNNYENNIVIGFLLLLLLFSFISPSHIIYTRMLIYFMPAIMISLPYILKLYNSESQKIIRIASIFLFMLMYFI